MRVGFKDVFLHRKPHGIKLNFAHNDHKHLIKSTGIYSSVTVLFIAFKNSPY